MFINTWNQKKHSISRFCFAIVAGVMMLAGFHQGAFAAEGSQKSFKSPEDAVKALTEAVEFRLVKPGWAEVIYLPPVGKGQLPFLVLIPKSLGNVNFFHILLPKNHDAKRLFSRRDRKIGKCSTIYGYGSPTTRILRPSNSTAPAGQRIPAIPPPRPASSSSPH